MTKSVTTVMSSVLSSIFKSTMSMLSALMHIVLVPVIAYYLLVSFEDIREGITDLIPPYTREPILQRLREMDMVLAAFIRGQLTIASILGVLYSLGFLMIGIDLALVLGLVSGVLWIVPYLGTLVAIVGGSALALAQFGDVTHVVYVWAWIGAVQLCEGYILTPKIVGEAIGLHPVVYILALIVGANLFGFVGMLVAIPVTAVLKVLLVSAAQGVPKFVPVSGRPNPITGGRNQAVQCTMNCRWFPAMDNTPRNGLTDPVEHPMSTDGTDSRTSENRGPKEARENGSGILYVVSTPIGNLSDITLRAIEVLRSVDLVACEDTRKSRILLQHWQISVPLISLHKFSEARKTRLILERLAENEQVALITDAGTPALSDPGSRLH